MSSVVLYGCETWSVMLTEIHGLTVFKNKLLRKKTKSGKRRVRNFVLDCRKPIVKASEIMFRVPITHSFDSTVM